MKITPIQKKIVYSIFGFILSIRALRYTFSKEIREIIVSSMYAKVSSVLYLGLFCIEGIVLLASLFGFWLIIRDLIDANRELIVRERFVRLLISSFWTVVVSIILALIVKVLIWP